ncbi:EAL domain-containing protein [Sphingomonas sp. S1-29]|uniref:putative bifunctional diguanylate cyclase/phosphodiesterase n=1 Tax=Sphingomonas sp. S1-29 TaxID=2991074 RepID=UPI002240BF41|nr:GGDEF domain-containing phosphodiesterase [Sphingomonas sp. S1-29]UZK69862.1 EAL domain-containing protein [Sphingomonas sp. S1-29]
MTQADASAAPHLPLFILSFRQRDELAALAARGGWRVVAARRDEAVERRFRASGAELAVVDARGSLAQGLAAVATLAGAGASRPGAIVACVSRGDVGALGDFYSAGATHFLVSPIAEVEFLHALRFARRGIAGEERGDDKPADMLGWRYDPARRTVQLTPALAAMLELGETQTVRALLRTIKREERRMLARALHRLAGGTVTAFAHDLSPLGRVVQHLQRDVRTGRLQSLVEPLGNPPDVGAVLRETMPAVRDEQGARQWIDHALRAGTALQVAVVTLARFDVVNMAYGRAAGDRLLRAAAKRIEEAASAVLGRRAMVARLGGADFAVATREGSDALARATQAVGAALGRPFVVGGEMVPMGARIATAASVEGDDATALLRRVGDALDAPRGEGGRDQIERLATELRQAMEAEQVDILFQPQVAIASGAIVGVEALARWRHPVLGELGAEMLFAAADRAGLALALSEHVQALALRRAAGWPAALGRLRLAINITAGDMAKPDFADILLGRIDASGFPRSRLTIEITESGLIEELGEAARLLAELRRAGCRVAIDDFGTGYSSLAYLKALPLDYLKIDKQLSQDIEGTPRDRIVVRGVIDMARSLGLSVIAEGVETEVQLDLLAKEGCQYFQGFLCAPPIDVAALVALVERQR